MITGKQIHRTITSCIHQLFSCSDGKCVVISVLCDFHVDCIDGEDEDCGK